LTDED